MYKIQGGYYQIIFVIDEVAEIFIINIQILLLIYK